MNQNVSQYDVRQSLLLFAQFEALLSLLNGINWWFSIRKAYSIVSFSLRWSPFITWRSSGAGRLHWVHTIDVSFCGSRTGASFKPRFQPNYRWFPCQIKLGLRPHGIRHGNQLIEYCVFYSTGMGSCYKIPVSLSSMRKPPCQSKNIVYLVSVVEYSWHIIELVADGASLSTGHSGQNICLLFCKKQQVLMSTAKDLLNNRLDRSSSRVESSMKGHAAVTD